MKAAENAQGTTLNLAVLIQKAKEGTKYQERELSLPNL